MNYDFRKHCKRFFAEGSIDAAEFDGRVTDMRMRYRRQTVYAQLNILDSHDVSRFLSVCGEDRRRYKLAIVFQMCFPGIPSVFYGDELGITGIREEEYRQPMPWGRQDELYAFFEQVIGMRKQQKALTQGDYHTINAVAGSRLYGFERTYGKQRVMIFLNMEEVKITCLIPENAEILMQEGWKDNILDPYGYVVALVQE